MKFKKFAAAIACGALVASLGLAGCSGSSSSSSSSSSAAADNTATEYELLNDGKLTVLLSPDYPPFENLSDSGELEGYEVELFKAVAEELGLEYNPVQLQFDAIIPAVVAGGQGDVGVSGFSVDPDRAKEIDFTTAYYIDDQAIAVMNDSGITTATANEELNEVGMVIAVQTGTTGEAYATENFPNATIQGYGNSTDCFAAMQSGQANAVCTNLAVVQRMLDTSYPDASIVITVATGEEYAAVVSQDNPALTAAINEALAKLEANGTVEMLRTQWF